MVKRRFSQWGSLRPRSTHTAGQEEQGKQTAAAGQVKIDYLFHLPSMVAALVLAYCFFSLLWERSGSGHL